MRLLSVSVGVVLLHGSLACAEPSRGEIEVVMKKAASYFRKEVAYRGGYVYYYSSDLTIRLGEGKATATEIWVQPPGTPTVGTAFLKAYQATNDPFYLEAAQEAGEALLYGQLESGGWRNSIEFDPSGPRVDQYRGGRGKGKDFSTLDDEISQSALLFLVRLDDVLGGEDAAIREAVVYGLNRMLAAQFANGAFPQGWRGSVEDRPILAASLPSYDWKTEGRIKNYWDHYTLNDGVADSVARLLIEAHRVYGEEKYLAALKKLGDFLKLAQLPEPQPGWAQQYGPEMHPIWARAFEPPALSGRESENAMIALIRIAEATGDLSYLEPVVRGVKYLERSLLEDGRLARFYELDSNRPLYMVRRGGAYELTFDDSRLPGHYGWKNPHELERIKAAYRAVSAGQPLSFVFEGPPPDAILLAKIVSDLDEDGRWITIHTPDGPPLVGQPKFQSGEAYLSSAVFAENLEILTQAYQR